MEPIKVILKPEIVMNKKIKLPPEAGPPKKSDKSIISTQSTKITKVHSLKLNNEPKIDYTMTEEDFYSLLENILYYIDKSCIQYLSYPNYETRVEEELWNYLYLTLPDDAIDDNKDILEDAKNNITTIPVMYGETNSIRISMVGLILSSLLLGLNPHYLDFPVVNSLLELQNSAISFLPFVLNATLA